MLECSEKVYSVEQKLRAFEYGQKLLGKKSLRRAWPRLPPERKLPKDNWSNCNSKEPNFYKLRGSFLSRWSLGAKEEQRHEEEEEGADFRIVLCSQLRKRDPIGTQIG